MVDKAVVDPDPPVGRSACRDVAVDDINYTTRSHVDVGSIAKAAAAKIGP